MAEPTGFSETPSATSNTGVVGLPDAAAVAADGDNHKSYVPAAVTTMPEFTWRAVIVGSALGIVFGASSLYLVLKVGMTVSASIPVAVLAITLFRGLSRVFGVRAPSILENNIMQTAGSAGESIAFGVGVTMPALMLIGFEMDITRIMVVSILGGLLGILMMIPLRRAFIVKLHGAPGEVGKLLYPEGTACAQVLISGEKGGTSGKTVFFGFGIAFLHKFVTEGMNLLKTTVSIPFKRFSPVAAFTGDMASELLGVGYIIGARISCIMFAGAVLGSLVIGPMIYFFGESVPGIVAPAGKPIAQMSMDDLHGGYIRFIGAGCVAAAGIISMCRTLPMIIGSFTSGVGAMGDGRGMTILRKRRTDDDLPMSFVLVGCLLLLILLSAFMSADVGYFGGILGAMLVLLFGFLFVTVSSRLTGEIGSSSNPISGMTVATLLMTCLIFLAVGRTSPQDAVLALSIGGVVCIAASNGGTTSQDLKTGFLVGGTPRWQQWAIIIGALTSALVIGFTLLLFNSAGNVYSERDLPEVNLKTIDFSDPTKRTESYQGAVLAGLTESETYQGATHHVWRPTLAEQTYLKVKPGKYLVDDAGQVRYHIDPTITGVLKQRDNWVADEVTAANLKGDVDSLKETVRIPKAGPDSPLQTFHVWKNSKELAVADANKNEVKLKGDYSGVPDGEYLVDESGAIRYENHPTKVNMKFEAPKTQVMGIIINGLLNGNLNWTLILIGAGIAVTMELCGVSSLAFAVGVYIPMEYSTPIFLGGLVRWAVDQWTMRAHRRAASEAATPEERARAEVEAIAKTETSPGVLLSSGLIAGGSLAGVTIAFLEFAPSIKSALDFSDRLKGTMFDPNSEVFIGRDLAENLQKNFSSILALIMFGVLIALLVLAGVGKILRQAPDKTGEEPTLPVRQ
jgi:putative OPT family oligopeptide transporter